MKTLAVLSRKGGTGKTTLAIQLAVAAEKAGHTTILIDLDPASVCCEMERLSRRRHAFCDNCTRIALAGSFGPSENQWRDARNFGYCTPYRDRSPGCCQRGRDGTDPCKPALIDLQAITSTINVTRLANVPARIIFNAVPPRGDRVQQAREAVKVFDVPCAPCEIGNRIAFSDSYNAGLTAQEYEPSGKASQEIGALYTYLSSEMGVS